MAGAEPESPHAGVQNPASIGETYMLHDSRLAISRLLGHPNGGFPLGSEAPAPLESPSEFTCANKNPPAKSRHSAGGFSGVPSKLERIFHCMAKRRINVVVVGIRVNHVA